MGLATLAYAGIDTWTTVGPIGGGVVYVAEDLDDPALIYASSFNPDRLYRSRDGGATWDRAANPASGGDDAYASFIPGNGAIYAINIVPAAFKSTNGGLTWDPLGPIPYGLQIQISEPGNPQVIYGIANAGGLKSTDGGTTWTALPTGVPDAGGWIGMLIDSNSPSTVYLYGYSRVMKSPDAGATWSVVNTGLGLFEISAMTQFGSTLLIATFEKGLFRSIDGGATWQPLNGGLTDLRVFSLAKGAGTLPVLFATVGEAPSLALIRSVDGGNTWTPTGATGIDRVVVSRLTPNRVYGVAMGTVAISNDAGNTWAAASFSSGLPNARVRRILVDANGTVLYADVDGALDGAARSTNGGGTWAPMKFADGNSLTPLSVSPTRAGVVYAVADNLSLGAIRSDDFGISWASVGAVLDFYPAAIEEARSRPQTVYIAGSRRVATGSRTYNSFPVVLRSVNGGGSWSDVSPLFPFTEVSRLVVAPTDERTVYAVAYSCCAGLLWTTSDGGQSWLDRSAGLPSSPIGALVVSPKNSRTAYVASNGVYRTLDGGASWSARKQGLPDALVTALAIDPGNPSILYAGFAGLGVFRTADAGEHWVPFGAGLGGPAGLMVKSIAIDPSVHDKLFVATDDGAYTLAYANYGAVDHAIEFYQAAFDHYFVATETQADVIALDSAVIPGWSRTARTFPVFPLATPGTSPVCRFFSGQTYAPRSSHFYTPYAAECASLKQGNVWQYEATVSAWGCHSGPRVSAPARRGWVHFIGSTTTAWAVHRTIATRSRATY
jgi:photosystem II stability/assembly factor-like uncharacterized protein